MYVVVDSEFWLCGLRVDGTLWMFRDPVGDTKTWQVGRVGIHYPDELFRLLGR
jgi:hypothetical protein